MIIPLGGGGILKLANFKCKNSPSGESVFLFTYEYNCEKPQDIMFSSVFIEKSNLNC